MSKIESGVDLAPTRSHNLMVRYPYSDTLAAQTYQVTGLETAERF